MAALIDLLKNSVDKWAALYCRLSRDDDNEGDSNSIAHQIEILIRYAREHGILRYKIYKDDGYSGTNFNRPGFQEMLADIEDGNVSVVIVKDMSRFGRNYLEVGMYTEILFPDKDVRFIAVNDGVDSDREDNDFTPFRNIINEWYAKDTSKKIRAAWRNKGLSGKRVSTQTPYGFLQNEASQFIEDEETAPVVGLMFQLSAEGNGTGRIARILTERKIPTPGTLAFLRTGRTDQYDPENPYLWHASTVARILDNRVYLGHTVNFRTTKKSYKNKKTIDNPEDKQVVFENTHPKLTDQDTWDLSQKTRQQRRRPTKIDDMGLFSGMLYCATCGKPLTIHRTYNGQIKNSYVCGTYKSKKGECSAHYIREVVLERLVLENLRKVIDYVHNYEDEFTRRVMANKLSAQMDNQAKAKRQLEQEARRIAELNTIIKRLYEDNISGKLTDERFMIMSTDYEREQRALEVSTAKLRGTVESCETQSANIKRFVKLVKGYIEPEELTPIMLHELVNKIIVHAPDKSSGHRTQQIDIFYNFVDEIELSYEIAQKETA